ncbi:hypothetical protein N7535_008044 [Penicillium sp. DV-2018c]|nr:hypothetical protein N7535_008044 [Penicillium sp. DV-2018c]
MITRQNPFLLIVSLTPAFTPPSLLSSSYALKYADRSDNIDDVLSAAPAGVAAHVTSSSTLHTPFRLPVPLIGKYEDLPASRGGDKVRDVQELFSSVRYLIIEEKSIFQDRRNEPFAGLGVIPAGDFFQLPAGFQKTLFIPLDSALSVDVLHALWKYNAFIITVELDTVVRQQGNVMRAIATARRV